MPVDAEEIQRRMERFSFEPFKKESSSTWEAYLFHFEKVCLVKGLGGQDERYANARKDLLLAYVGATPLQEVTNFFYPRNVDDCTYEEVKAAFYQLYRPNITLFAARMAFEKAVRQQSETFTDYANRLRRLSTVCQYGSTLDERLRDRFVAGANHTKLETEVRQKWPEGKLENGQPLHCQDVLNLALSIELAEAEVKPKAPAKSLEMVNTTKHANHRLWKDKLPTSQQDFTKITRENKESAKWKAHKLCKNCGGMWHKSRKECPALKQQCRTCKKWGHFSRVCLAAKGEGSAIKVVADNVEPTTIKALSPKAIIQVELNGLPFDMEYDTGAGASIINTDVWKRLGKPQLTKSRTELVAYAGKPLKTLGTASLKVSLNNKTLQLEAMVVETRDAPLFGLPWLLAFELPLPNNVRVHSALNETSVISPEPSNMNVGEDESAACEMLLKEFPEVFAEGFGLIRGSKATLHMKPDVQPVFIPARRTPFPLRKPIENELQRLEQADIIEKVDPATTAVEWATPTVNVLKGDGAVRICGDFRTTINPNLVSTHHLLPTFEDITSRIVGGQKFSVIDLKDAYLQMSVDEESQKYLVISTHKGFFRYKRMPFGIAAAPAIFQRFMDDLLQDIDHVGVLLDDVIVTGVSREEHLQNLRKVLLRFQTVGLKAKKTKLKLFQDSVVYLGHRIDAQGVHPTDEKIRAIRDTPTPRNVSELRSFLGLVNYYERFIPHLHSECADLHSLTGTKVAWKWTEKCQKTFQKAKELLTSDATLVPYDESLPVVIACDASEKGLGAVISHIMPTGEERPIAFGSRTLTEAERKYSSLDREALALIFGVTKFHQFVYGRRFTLLTDHKPLTYIFGDKRDLSKAANNRVARWALTLAKYDYEIRFRPGKENAGADGLSRLPLPEMEVSDEERVTIHETRKQSVADIQLTERQLRHESRHDRTLNAVQQMIDRKTWPRKIQALPINLRPYFDKKDELSNETGIVMWLGRIVVPTKLRPRVLATLHEGHPGITAMKSIARQHVWWPKMDVDIESTVKKCVPCQENRSNEMEMPLYSWNVPNKAWERIHIDLTGNFYGRKWLLGVDAYSKWPEAEPLVSTKAEVIIDRLRTWFARYGIPSQIVTDNGKNFTGFEFKKFCKDNCIKHICIAPYHPRSNGQVERFVRTFKSRLSACKREGGTLNLALQKMLLSYRNTVNSTTGRTPAELLIGHRLDTIFDKLKPDPRRQMDNQFWRQKSYHDRRAKLREFEPNEEVWVRTETDRSPRWRPGVIESRTGPASYLVRVAGQLRRKHADHLRAREGAANEYFGQ